MPADLAALAPKLDPLIRRLGTNHDGERLATVAALERTLATARASFHDLADAVVTGTKPPVKRDPLRPSPGRATWADLLAMASKLDRHPDLKPVGEQLRRQRAADASAGLSAQRQAAPLAREDLVRIGDGVTA